jgi:D-psicose/D-tagatose/L-ribulose 3-epimerase
MGGTSFPTGGRGNPRTAEGNMTQIQNDNIDPGETIMKYGMNLLLWTGDLHEGMLPVLEMLKNMGYDGVELPIFDFDVDKYAKWGKRLDEMGLERTAVTVRGADDNPISPDAGVRAKGVENTCRVLDCCQAAGATTLVGPYHSALGIFSGQGPTDDEWKWGVESMQKVAEHAERTGVTLGVECLNRFETYLLTCHSDAARFARAVNHPRCRIMYDTFHANIEEKDIPESIRGCADMICHVHISENDRSTPGLGHVRWAETFDTLREIGYDGWLMIEAFGLALPELVAATKIWRRMYTDEEQLARDGLAFMKSQVAQRA